MRDRLPVSQDDVALGKQPQRPALPTARRRATGEGNQVRFLFSVHFRSGTGSGWVPLHCRDALGDEPLPHARDGGAADIEGGDDLGIAPRGAVGGLVRFEQDARTGEGAGRGCAPRDERLQRDPLLARQDNMIDFLHR